MYVYIYLLWFHLVLTRTCGNSLYLLSVLNYSTYKYC